MVGSMKKMTELPYLLSSEERFSDFFSSNYRAACLIALRYVKDVDLAEDLVQDVFVAFWENSQNLGPVSNLKNYFFTAIKNHAINLIQRNKSNTISLASLFIDISEDENADHFADEELAVKICQAIDELPTACRKIFLLAYQNNFTYQQIADQLNISKNTVKTQIRIAYKQLRDKLNGLIVSLLFLIQKK